MRVYTLVVVSLLGLVCVAFLRTTDANPNGVALKDPVVDVQPDGLGIAVAEFVIENKTSRSITVTAIMKSCDCASTKELPIKIAGFDSLRLPISINCSGMEGPLEKRFYFLTDPPFENLIGTVRLRLSN